MQATPRGEAVGAGAQASSAPVRAPSPSPFRIECGVGVVAEVERSICGVDAVATDKQAEGLALAGQRSARALSETEPVAMPRAAWVLHKVGMPAQFGAFTFAAADAQEAADHSLAAQVLCALTGSAAQCVVGAGFAARPWQYRPLAKEAVDAAFALQLSSVSDRGAAAEAVLAHVSSVADRPCLALHVQQSSPTECVLVAYGEDRERALDIAHVLASQGTAVGTIGVAQLRPFPDEALAALLRGKRNVVVIGRDEGFAEDVERSAARARDGQPIHVRRVDGRLSEVQRALGLEQRPDDADAEPCVTIGVAPAGRRAQELLFSALSRVAEPLTAFAVPSAAALAAVGLGRRLPAQPPGAIDVAVVAHPSLLDASLALNDAARVILVHEAASADEVVASFSLTQRALIKDKGLRVDWLPAPQADAAAGPGADWTLLQDALLEATNPLLSARLGVAESALKATGMVRLDPTQPAKRRAKEVDFRAPRKRPRLPTQPAEPKGAWRLALRRFHLTTHGAAGATALLPLAPALATPLLRHTQNPYPLVVMAGQEPEIVPFSEFLARSVEAMQKAGTALSILVEQQARLVFAAQSVVAERGTLELAEMLDASCQRFSAELSLSEKASATLGAELDALRAHARMPGRVLGLSRPAHLELYAAAVLPERRRRRAVLEAEVRSLHQRLSDMLAVDQSHDAAAPEQLAKSLGATDFVDPTAFSRVVQKRPGSKRMPKERRARIQSALQTLGTYLERMRELPELFLVSAERAELGPWRVHWVEHPSPLGVAVGLFDGLAREITPVLSALRVARLEANSRYDASVHGPVLAEFDWTRFEDAELLCLPPVLAVEAAEHIWQTSQRALSDVMQSGRPIHVVVEEAFGSDAEQHAPGLGYALVAQREAVVVQTTLARPDHFVRGLSLIAKALRPAVAVLAPCPAPGPMPNWVRLAAAHAGRALPCFCYAPDRGLTWAESFDIAGNPSAETSWVSYAIDAEDDAGNAHEIVEHFTFAHAAALELGYRHHFWVVPPEAWSGEQVPLHVYLEEFLGAESPAVPFLWITDDAGNMGRAIVSSELVAESHRRMRLWRALEELGGARNEYARRAASEAREVARAEADAQLLALETRHVAELARVRDETAAEALGRLAQVLMDPAALDSATAAIVPASGGAVEKTVVLPMLPRDDSVEASPVTEPSPAPAAEEEDVVSFSDPFVDTVLCTTCNECTNINPQMFQYNSDKQAVITDPAAGTFAQLVKAAEKCPAKCIHPGAPRKDDQTATSDLVARAEPFN